jgi:hypothetical protein
MNPFCSGVMGGNQRRIVAGVLANLSLVPSTRYTPERGPKVTNLGNEFLELRLRDKVVLSSVYLSRSRVSGRIYRGSRSSNGPL